MSPFLQSTTMGSISFTFVLIRRESDKLKEYNVQNYLGVLLLTCPPDVSGQAAVTKNSNL